MNSKFSLAPIQKFIDYPDIFAQIVSGFKCKKGSDLEKFLKTQALENEKRGFSRTFLIIDKIKYESKNEFKILGFISLALKILNIQGLNPTQKKALTSCIPYGCTLAEIPTYLIGQLGRCDSCKKDVLSGKEIFTLAISQLKNVIDTIGGEIIILDCESKLYEKFYSQFGFKIININSTSDDDKDLITIYLKYKNIKIIND